MTQAAAETQAGAPVAAADVVGKYTAFGGVADQLPGYVISLGESRAMDIVFAEDGTVTITATENGNTENESGTWTVSGNTVTMTNNGSSITGTLKDGIFTLDTGVGASILFAKEGTDISSIKVYSEEEIAQIASEATKTN